MVNGFIASFIATAIAMAVGALLLAATKARKEKGHGENMSDAQALLFLATFLSFFVLIGMGVSASHFYASGRNAAEQEIIAGTPSVRLGEGSAIKLETPAPVTTVPEEIVSFDWSNNRHIGNQVWICLEMYEDPQHPRMTELLNQLINVHQKEHGVTIVNPVWDQKRNGMIEGAWWTKRIDLGPELTKTSESEVKTVSTTAP